MRESATQAFESEHSAIGTVSFRTNAPMLERPRVIDRTIVMNRIAVDCKRGAAEYLRNSFAPSGE